MNKRWVWGAWGKSWNITISEKDLAKWIQEKNYRAIFLTAAPIVSLALMAFPLSGIFAIKVDVIRALMVIFWGFLMLLITVFFFVRSCKKV